MANFTAIASATATTAYLQKWAIQSGSTSNPNRLVLNEFDVTFDGTPADVAYVVDLTRIQSSFGTGTTMAGGGLGSTAITPNALMSQALSVNASTAAVPPIWRQSLNWRAFNRMVYAPNRQPKAAGSAWNGFALATIHVSDASTVLVTGEWEEE